MDRRFEQRYIVPEDTAVALRSYVQRHLKLDEYGEGKENFSYEVHNLYLDSDDLQLYWRFIDYDENQITLRLHFYRNDPAAPVFLETKHRIKDYLVKERVPVRRHAAALLFSQRDPSPDFLTSRTGNHMLALDRSCKIVRNLELKPKLHVAFSREAYRADNASLNFDRFVRAEPAFSTDLRPEMQHPTFVWNNDVVLEMKFMDEEPEFFGQIVHHFALRPCGVEKYVDAIALHGERRFRS